MNRSQEIVATLDDVQAVSLLKRLNQVVYREVGYDEVVSRLDRDSAVAKLVSLSPDEKRITMDAEHSVLAIRAVLAAFAEDESLAPLVGEAWEEIKGDDSLFVESVVAIGLVLNLALFLATTSGKFKFKHGVIEKHVAGPEILKPILNPLTQFLKLRATKGT